MEKKKVKCWKKKENIEELILRNYVFCSAIRKASKIKGFRGYIDEKEKNSSTKMSK